MTNDVHSHDDQAKQNIAMLQNLEHSLQTILLQKQNFQSQLIEVESALEELKDKESAYKIIGNIMVSAKKDVLVKELEEKKDKFNLRIQSLEKQENNLKSKAESMQKEVMENMKRK
jgi:prefoldin beta subunit